MSLIQKINDIESEVCVCDVECAGLNVSSDGSHAKEQSNGAPFGHAQSQACQAAPRAHHSIWRWRSEGRWCVLFEHIDLDVTEFGVH